MKHIIFLLFVILCNNYYSQVYSSSCEIENDSINELYSDYADQLALRFTHQSSSNYVDSIFISTEYVMKFQNALNALHNVSEEIPLLNALVNEELIAPIPYPGMHSIAVKVDTLNTWWLTPELGGFPSGYPEMDDLVETYGFSLANFLDWGDYFGHDYLVINTEEHYNIIALSEVFEALVLVSGAYPDEGYGDGSYSFGDIEDEYVTIFYKLGYGDCQAGCIYNVYYEFRVYDEDCSVEYIGMTNNNPYTPPVTIQDVTIIPPVCSDSLSGQIEISASGGELYYWYQINDGGFSYNNEFTGLASGEYSLEVRDVFGTTAFLDIVIPSSDQLDFETEIANTSCHSETDGSLNVIVSNGSSPYLYQLNDGEMTSDNSFGNLSAGVYALMIQDNDECFAFDSISISSPDSLVALVTTSEVSCADGVNGQIFIETSGGTAPYNYELVNQYSDSSGVFINLTAGDYLIEVTDVNGCSIDVGAEVVEPTPILFENLIVPVSCSGLQDGEISINPTGGTPPFLFYLDGESTESSGNFSGLYAGEYDFQIFDQNGCLESISLSVSEPSELTFQTNIEQFGDSTSSITVFAEGGSPPYLYGIDNFKYGPDSIFSAVPLGSHLIQIIDSNGCVFSSNLIITSVDDLRSLLKEQENQLYPNPVKSDHFTLSIPLNSQSSCIVELMSLGGELIISEEFAVGSSPCKIYCPHITRGLYLVKITTIDGVDVKKLVLE